MQIEHRKFKLHARGHAGGLPIDDMAGLVPIGAKSGQTVASDFFADLDYWQNLVGQASGGAALDPGVRASYKRQRVSVIS